MSDEPQDRSDDDVRYAIEALTGIGLPAGIYCGMSGHSRRHTFQQALRQALTTQEVRLGEANLGRSHGGVPVWVVTLNHPLTGIHLFQLRFDAGIDPYSLETLNQVITRLLAEIEAFDGAMRIGDP